MNKKAGIIVFTLYMLLMISVIFNILTLGNPDDHQIFVRLIVLVLLNVTVEIFVVGRKIRTKRSSAPSAQQR